MYGSAMESFVSDGTQAGPEGNIDRNIIICIVGCQCDILHVESFNIAIPVESVAAMKSIMQLTNAYQVLRHLAIILV